jgi:hypothetical protein
VGEGFETAQAQSVRVRGHGQGGWAHLDDRAFRLSGGEELHVEIAPSALRLVGPVSPRRHRCGADHRRNGCTADHRPRRRAADGD